MFRFAHSKFDLILQSGQRKVEEARELSAGEPKDRADIPQSLNQYGVFFAHGLAG